MSQTTLTRPELGKLSAYSNDGLELFISDNGSVYASQSAIARMLGMQQGHLSSVLKYPILPTSAGVETSHKVRLPSASGVREQTLYGVSTIIALATRYNQAVAQKFAEMGATVYLYKLAGYKVEMVDAVKVITPPEPSMADTLKTAYDALGKLVNIQGFAQDMPGLQAYLKLAESGEKSMAISGKMTIDQMAAHCGYVLTSEQNRQIGRSMSGIARSQEAMAPTTIRKRVKDKSGNHQSYWVMEYSTKYLPLFISTCETYGNIQLTT